MALKIIPRKTWGSQYDYAARRRAKPAKKAKAETVLHTSVTIAPDLKPPFDDEYAAMRTLERIGTERFNAGISYNYAVMPNGNVYEGMPLDIKATHSEYGDWNYTRASIVLVGKGDKNDPMSDAEIRAVAEIQAMLRRKKLIQKVNLRWHAQVAAKACPGENAIRKIPDINRRTNQLLKPARKQYHTVKQGEWLGKIAAKYKKTVSAIMRLNPSIKDADEIRPGQRIRVR